ncbi:hypothetical protein M5C72_04860 [Companilactobacillus allii]|jgi:hypothetical protein|uniref:hypothetical protein n=1 Tax=Companilactobacillus allii TaxID=1847728 RepID=UPI0012FF6291|nr:hypothetical protein [Companilactobacillus allii]USQ69552.1 hypothetical protein M5C72_04860 [Companilactobacillus allii]
MDKFNYVKELWYLDSKAEIKTSLQERHLTFEQAQVVLEDTIRDLNNESKSRLL